MIFKTFDSDIDKISAKWGVFGKSFNEIGTAIVGRISDINKGFQATYDLLGAFGDTKSIWKRLYPSKESIQSQLIDVDKLYPKIDANNITDVTKKIKVLSEDVANGTTTWQKLFDTLPEGQKYFAKLGQQMEGQIITNEGVAKANENARQAALTHNAALKQQTLGAKATTLALKGLSIAANIGFGLLVSWGLPALIKLIDSHITTFKELNEQIEESRENYEETTDKIERLNSELETTQERIEELNRLDKLSAVEADELKKLEEYNAELERNKILEEEAKSRALEKQVNDIKDKYSKKKYEDDTFSSLRQLEEFDKKIAHLEEYIPKLLEIAGLRNTNLKFDSVNELLAFVNNPNIKEHLSPALKREVDNLKKLLDSKDNLLNSDVTDEMYSILAEIETLKTDGLNVGDNRKYYDLLTGKLNEYYKTFLSSEAYYAIQIEPVFKDEKFSGLKDNILTFFKNGGLKDDIENEFGKEVISSLKSAFYDAGVDFSEVLDFLYGEATNNFNTEKVIESLFGGLYRGTGADVLRKNLTDIVTNMDTPTISLLLEFSSENGYKYNSIEEFMEAFYKSLETASEDSSIIFTLSESEREALKEYQTRLELLNKLKDEWFSSDAIEKSDLLQSFAEQFPKYDLMELINVENAKELEGKIGNWAISLYNNIAKFMPDNMEELLGEMLFPLFGIEDDSEKIKFNFIDRVIEETERGIKELEDDLSNASTLNDKIEKSKLLSTALDNYNTDILEKSAKLYFEKSKSILSKIPQKYHEAIKNGIIDIKTIDNKQYFKLIEAKKVALDAVTINSFYGNLSIKHIYF